MTDRARDEVERLLPCPFCGSAPIVVAGIVGCPECASGQPNANRWNTRATLTPASTEAEGSFQQRVQPWMMECFGEKISSDLLERCDRFLEEDFELVQALGYPKERVAALRDYTWSRPKGEPSQEVGGVMVTLAALCLAADLDMHEAGETELARIWTKVEQIRAKQAAKPTGSALPVSTEALKDETVGDVERVAVALFKNDDQYRNKDWEFVSDRLRELFRSDARAALTALSRPVTQDGGEREAIVRWLRLLDIFEGKGIPKAIANAIEAGDHLKGNSDG